MDAEKLIESIIRSLMFLAGILGNNWLAIRSLPGKISSIRTNEVLFINLAISNLITNYLVDLPDTIADFAGRWFLGETFCGVFRFCADLSETSSIYTTFFISTYWHQKLVGSLKLGGAPVKLDSLCVVGCLLVGSWTLALAFSIPHIFFVKVEGANGSHEDCIDVFPDALARKTYEIFYLTLANAVPVAGILFASVQIVITLLLNQRRIQSQRFEATKETVKEDDKGTGNTDYMGSVSSDSGQGASEDDKCSSSVNVYTGVPPSTCPNGGGRPERSSATEKEANPGSGVGMRPNLSRAREPAKASTSSSAQVRAAKSVVAVASVFLICWLTHLLLRITNSIHTSSLVVEVASYIAASYTCIIPYIFLYGVKKLSCSFKR